MRAKTDLELKDLFALIACKEFAGAPYFTESGNKVRAKFIQLTFDYAPSN